jgi:hypothetical protein
MRCARIVVPIVSALVCAVSAYSQVCEPTVIRSTPVEEGLAYRPVVADGFLYVPVRPRGAPSGLRIYDISEPLFPRQQSQLPLENPQHVAVADDVAIVTSSLGSDRGILRTVDVSDPGAPQLLGELTLDAVASGLAVVDSTAYVTLSGFGLTIVDIAEPQSPRVVSTLAMSGTPYGIAVEGSIAYVTAGDEGLRVIDVTDPAAPVEVGSLTTGIPMYRVAVAEGLAGIGAEDNVLIADVADPASPALLATIPRPSLAIADVALDPPLLWFSTAEYRASLVALDISKPRVPLIAGELKTVGSHAFRILLFALDGSSAHVVDVEYIGLGGYQFQLSAVDISSCGACPADCDASGSLDFFDFLCFQNLFAAGDLAADCDGSGELDLLDFLCFQNEFAAGCP